MARIFIFPVRRPKTRGHRFKVRGGKFKEFVGVKFFLHRIVGAWNVLAREGGISRYDIDW